MKKIEVKPEGLENVGTHNILKNTKGITLIALVITIIVLIILAGVAINTLTGDNSIINNAIKAKEETQQKNDEEQLKIAIASSYDYNKGSTNIIIDDLNNNLKQIDGFDESTMVKKLPSVVKIHENEYEIDRKGNVIKLMPGEEEFPIYAVFYTDKNELVFQTSDAIDTSRGDVENGTATLYSGIETLEISAYTENPWYADGNYSLIQTVTFAERIYPKSTAYWFYECENLININNIENLKTKNVTNMSSMFSNCKSLTSLDVSNFDTSKVTNMVGMFYYCSGLTSLDLSNFDTSNVTEMNAMFYYCSGLTSLDVSNFDTSKVTNMQIMFYHCRELTSLDLSNFNTSNVTNMGIMFFNCWRLNKIYVGENWTTKSVISSGYTSGSMFYNCTSLVGAISYDSSKTDVTYANYETGYLTLKTD